MQQCLVRFHLSRKCQDTEQTSLIQVEAEVHRRQNSMPFDAHKYYWLADHIGYGLTNKIMKSRGDSCKSLDRHCMRGGRLLAL